MPYLAQQPLGCNTDHRAYRLLIDKNLTPALAMAVAGDPVACRGVLGDLTPGAVMPRPRLRRRA